MTVHLVQYGMVACFMDMPPAVWPEGHKWSSDLKDVTCGQCRMNATETPLTFELIDKAIKCRICGFTDHNPDHVVDHRCGHCGIYHDNLWPPSRKPMMENPDKFGISKFNP